MESGIDLSKAPLIFDLDKLKSAKFPLDEFFYLVVKDDGVKYQFLVRLSSSNENMICFGSEEFDPEKEAPPIFRWHSLEDRFEESVIFYNDPTLYLDQNLRVGWGVGKNDNWYMSVVADIIRVIMVQRGIKPENMLFFGKSGGGFTALILSTLIKNSMVMIDHPELFIRSNPNFKQILDACFDDPDKDAVLEEYGYRFDPIKLFRLQEYMPQITLLVDKSTSEMENQAIPFFDSLTSFEQVNEKLNILAYEAEGEPGVDKEATILRIKDHFSQIPDFKLFEKSSIKGKDGYLFLINDSNNEIGQHFDGSYKNKFDTSIFLKNLDYKKEYCQERNIKHQFFIIPDKSLICKDLLPFTVPLIKRNYDLIKNFVPDFANNLNYLNYFKSDSHINYIGGRELTYRYLNYIDKNFKRKNLGRLLAEQMSISHKKYTGDIALKINFSYSDAERKYYQDEDIITLESKCLENLKTHIPPEFKSMKKRETEYYKNKKSFTQQKVLIFRDSSLTFFKDVFSVYFKEMLLYWDYWYFNEDLIKWYKPDIVLEIRTERFLENMKKEIDVE